MKNVLVGILLAFSFVPLTASNNQVMFFKKGSNYFLGLTVVAATVDVGFSSSYSRAEGAAFLTSLMILHGTRSRIKNEFTELSDRRLLDSETLTLDVATGLFVLWQTIRFLGNQLPN